MCIVRTEQPRHRALQNRGTSASVLGPMYINLGAGFLTAEHVTESHMVVLNCAFCSGYNLVGTSRELVVRTCRNNSVHTQLLLTTADAID